MASGLFPINALAAKDYFKLTILHTNDLHSRIEAFPMDGSRNEGKAGMAARAGLINRIRQEEEHVLLFDAGDIFQGTPYFNFFHGELELRLMSQMGYDAATIGNHEFDSGIENLAKQLQHSNFPFITSNYDFSNTVMAGKTVPYKVFEKGKLKIGVLGVVIKLDGLVPENLYGSTRYLDPVKKANEISSILRHELDCDFIICLSHLGLKYNTEKVSDEVLAQNSRYIDLIIGGHTHTYMKNPNSYENLDSQEVLVFQTGSSGVYLGRMDYYFENKFSQKRALGTTVIVK